MKVYACILFLRIVASAVFDTADISPKNDINSQVGKDIEISISLKPDQINNGCTIEKVKIYVKGENLTELSTIYNDTTLVLWIQNAQTTDSGFYMIVCDDQGSKKSFLGARYVNVIHPPSPVYDFQCFSANWVEMECTWKVHNHEAQHVLYYSVFDYPALIDKNMCPSYRSRHGFHGFESLPGVERRPFLQGMAKGAHTMSATENFDLSFQPVNKCRFVNKPSAILSAAAGHKVLTNQHPDGNHLEFFPDWTYYFIMVSKNAIGTIKQNFTAKPKDIVKPDPPKIHVTAGMESVTIGLISSVTVSPDGMPLQYCLNVTSAYLDLSNFSLNFTFDFVSGTVLSAVRSASLIQSTAYPTLTVLKEGRTLVVDGLLPYLSYDMEIRAKPLHNGYISEPNVFMVQTLEKAPKIIPETSVSGFELARTYTEDSNKITLYWKSVPRAYQFGPDFHYNLYDWDSLIALNLTNNFYSLQLKRVDVAEHMFRVTASNSMGEGLPSVSIPFCQKTLLNNPQNVRIIHYAKSAYTLAWNNARLVDNINAYTIYWCKTHQYIPFTCGPDIEWITLSLGDKRVRRHGPPTTTIPLTKIFKNVSTKAVTKFIKVNVRPDRDVFTFNLTLDTNFLAGVAYESSSNTHVPQGIVWGLCVLKYQQKPKAPRLSFQSWTPLSSRAIKIEWTKEACQSEGGPVAFYELYYAPVVLNLTYAKQSQSDYGDEMVAHNLTTTFVRSNIRGTRSFGSRLSNLAFLPRDPIRKVNVPKFERASASNDDYIDDLDERYSSTGPVTAITGIPYGNSTYAILVDLEPDTSYMVWMKSLSLAKQYSQPSLRILASTLEDVPADACTSLSFTRTNESYVNVSWKLPLVPNGRVIYCNINFTKIDTRSQRDISTVKVDKSRAPLSILYKVRGAANHAVLPLKDWAGDTSYAVDVVACNSIGCSPPVGKKLKFTTPISEPSIMDQPDSILLYRDRVMITWRPPTQPNGPIIHYDILLYRQNNSRLVLEKSYLVPVSKDGSTSFNLSIQCPSPDENASKIEAAQNPTIQVTTNNYGIAPNSDPLLKYFLSIRAVNRDPVTGFKRFGPYTPPKLIPNVCYKILSILRDGPGVSIQSQQRKTFVITGTVMCVLLIFLLLYFSTGINRHKLILWIRNLELKATLPWDEEEYQRYHLQSGSFSDEANIASSSSQATAYGRAKRWKQPDRLEKISNIDLYLIKDGQPPPNFEALGLSKEMYASNVGIAREFNVSPRDAPLKYIHTPLSIGSFSFDSGADDYSIDSKSVNDLQVLSNVGILKADNESMLYNDQHKAKSDVASEVPYLSNMDVNDYLESSFLGERQTAIPILARFEPISDLDLTKDNAYIDKYDARPRSPSLQSATYDRFNTPQFLRLSNQNNDLYDTGNFIKHNSSPVFRDPLSPTQLVNAPPKVVPHKGQNPIITDPYADQSQCGRGGISYMSDYGSLISPLSSVTYSALPANNDRSSAALNRNINEEKELSKLICPEPTFQYDPYYGFDEECTPLSRENGGDPSCSTAFSNTSQYNSGYVDA